MRNKVRSKYVSKLCTFPNDLLGCIIYYLDLQDISCLNLTLKTLCDCCFSFLKLEI